MNFTLWTEKIAHKGEDAEPSLILQGGAGLLAVYDGLGGAGSKPYTLQEGKINVTYSGAALAARLAKNTLEILFSEGFLQQEDFPLHLSDKFKTAFDEYYQQLPTQKSLLRSKLIKKLPTTLAGIVFETLEREYYKIQPFWAGDSRCYVLQENGLIQLSVDDLVGKPDALENLLEDATLSNCIQAENAFAIQHKPFYVEGPCILITASDGCFGYLPSPQHFEFLLLDTLMNSYYDIEDWKEKLQEALEAYTADDMSLSLCVLGFPNLNQLKTTFFPRHQLLFQQFIYPLTSMEDKFERSLLENQGNDVEEFQEERRNTLLLLWEKYKLGYYPIDSSDL